MASYLLLILALGWLQDPEPHRTPEELGMNPARTMLVDQLLATVNDQVITLRQVTEEARLRAGDRPLSPGDRELLQAFTFRDLLVDALFREGYRLSGLESELVDRVVGDEIQKKIDDYGSLSAFTADLQVRGRTLDEEVAWMRRYYTAVLFQLVEIGNLPAKQPKGYKTSRFISPLEIRRHYQENAGEFQRERRVEMRMIQISDEPGSEPAAVRIRKLEEQIRSGALGFEDAARRHSSYRPTTGGYRGFVSADVNLARPIKEFLEEATGPSLSPPIRVTNALSGDALWTLIQVESVQAGGSVPFEEVQLRIAGRLLEDRGLELLRAAVLELRARCNVWGPEVDAALDSAFVRPPEAPDQG